MEPSKTSQTRWERHHNTFTPSLHLVPFCQLCTTKNSTHSLNAHGTQHCSLNSLPHKRLSIPDSATFSSSKIYNINYKLPTYHADPALHAHSFCIQGRLYLPCSTATTLVTKYPLFHTKCFIRKQPKFRLQFCSLHQSIHSSLLCMLCML